MFEELGCSKENVVKMERGVCGGDVDGVVKHETNKCNRCTVYPQDCKQNKKGYHLP